MCLIAFDAEAAACYSQDVHVAVVIAVAAFRMRRALDRSVVVHEW